MAQLSAPRKQSWRRSDQILKCVLDMREQGVDKSLLGDHRKKVNAIFTDVVDLPLFRTVESRRNCGDA